MKAARMGSEEAMHPDRISHLPDDLLLQILSLVPVRTALYTSFMSKRWQPVWKMMPTLVYDETCPYNGSLRFDQFCGMSLPLHEALKTLKINLRNRSDSIDTLLFPNIRSTLLEMTIDLNNCYPYSPIRFPNNLNVFKTLLVLKLQGLDLNFVDSPVCFPSLKRLRLIYVRIEHEESFTRLLSACPVLEDLYLGNFCDVGPFLFTISSLSLQRLSIDTAFSHYRFYDPRFEINTPFLKYLKIFDRTGIYNFLEDMPELMEANISVHEPKIGNLMKVFTSLEHLSLSLYPRMASHFKGKLISKRILRLELGIFDPNLLSLLMYLLEGFPKLRSLKLTKVYWFPKRDIEDQPSFVPECLSFHLETLEWIGYEGTLKEKELATYILGHAHCLKTATISLHSTDTENRMLIVNDLLSLTKASASCRLVIL